MSAPGPDPDARRTVLRQFSYGLFAVSAACAGERGIFTANWLTQVSFDPCLVALSVERDSSTLPLIEGSGRFVVAPLRAGDRELAANLGRSKVRVGDKIDAFGIEVVATSTGEPVPATALGYLACTVRDRVEAGDSILFIGEVIDAKTFTAGDPLTMRDAGFRHAG